MQPRQGEVWLTPREEAALRLFNVNGELNEGLMHDAWPLIRRPRNITNSLLHKGLVVLGVWWDEAGYELDLTPAGLEAAGRLAEPDA